MRKNIFLSVFSLVLSICCFAKGEVNDTLSVDTRDFKEKEELRTIDVAERQKQIKELQEKVKSLTESVNTLKGKQFDDRQKIEAQEVTIKRLEKRLVFADTIIARLSNDCLRHKYDAGKVANAISNFEQMYSEELKGKFHQLKVLLTEYGKYTHEIESVFIEAQNDKALRNPFTGQKQAHTYIDKIKATSYYMNVYDENWTIPYLNSVIDKSIEVIKSYNPKEMKDLQLFELMK